MMKVTARPDRVWKLGNFVDGPRRWIMNQVAHIGRYALPGPPGETAHIAGYALPANRVLDAGTRPFGRG